MNTRESQRFTHEGTLLLSAIAGDLRAIDSLQPVEICADTLVVDASLDLALSDLSIHARVVSCPRPARIACATDGGRGLWRVFVGQIQGEAAAALELRSMGLRLPLDPAASGFQAFQVSWSAGDGGSELRLEEPRALAGDSLVLTDILLAARRLGRADPTSAIARARWVVAASAAGQGQERLFAESVQLLSHLTSPQRGFHLVPYLERQQYVAQAGALLDALSEVDADLRVVADREYDIAARRATAQGLLQRLGHTAELTRHLLEQSDQNLRAAQSVGEQAGHLLTLQHAATGEAQKSFAECLEEWQRRQTILAVFTAILGLGLAVAAICTANPAGAAAGIGAAAQAARDAGTAAERIRKIIELIQKIKDTIEESKKLAQLIDGINKIREAIASGQSAAALVEDARQGWAAMPAEGTSMRPEDWDLLKLEMAPMLGPAIEAGVPGAGEYLREIEKLVIRGKAGFFADVHAIECAQRYQQMLWTLDRDRADEDSLRAEIDAIQEGEPLQRSLRLRFEHARDDIRARVVLAIENLADAHRYFALAEGAVRADPSMSTAELRSALARAADELVAAYERFDPRPRSWSQTLPIEMTDERRAALLARGALTVTLPMVDANFPNYTRIRVAQVKAFFVGAACPPREEIQLEIATGDHYRDRYGVPQPRPFDFAGRPVRLGFAYRHRDGIHVLPVEGDPEASVDISFGGEPMDEWDVFFEPTPFTEWQIRLPREGNEHLDLTSCRRVDLHLRGSAVLGGFAAAPREAMSRESALSAAPLIAALDVGTDPPTGDGHG